MFLFASVVYARVARFVSLVVRSLLSSLRLPAMECKERVESRPCSELGLPPRVYLHVPLQCLDRIGRAWKKTDLAVAPLANVADGGQTAGVPRSTTTTTTTEEAAVLAILRADEPGSSLAGFDARSATRHPEAFPLRVALVPPPGSRGCRRSRRATETVVSLAESGFRVCVERTSDDCRVYRLLFPSEDAKGLEWRDPESGAWIPLIGGPPPSSGGSAR